MIPNHGIMESTPIPLSAEIREEVWHLEPKG